MDEREPAHLLVVEDNPIDARAALKALKNLSTPYVVEVAQDGDAAIRYLSAAGPKPALILLDLNLPGRDGFDVLSHVKQDVDLRRIPVVILTTSSSDVDVLGAYDLGANAYVNKPHDLAGWNDTVSRIENFWLSLVRLPPT